jgi:hypothetical protein
MVLTEADQRLTEADTETFFLEMASGVQELLCSERIALLAPPKSKGIRPCRLLRPRKNPLWLAMIAENDFRNLPSIIAADAIFHSPVGLKPYPGRDLVCLLLSTAAGVFQDFKYHREFLNGENAAPEFSAHIGDVELKAVHLIRFNAAGEFVEIEKLVRPAEGVKALGNAMAALIGPQVKALRAVA